MPDEKLREKINGTAASALKKIIASKGKVKGNFYYVGDSAAEDAGVVITLSTRDAKGAKVVVLGKKLRKDVRNGKYGIGTVVIKDNKLLFEQTTGNISAANIKLGFKKTLANEAGLKFLSRAVVRAAGASVETSSEAGGEAEETITEAELSEEYGELTAEEAKELAALEVEQEALNKSNGTLSAAFSNAESDNEILDKAIEDSIANITSLASSGASMAEIQQARCELAEMMYVGEDPFSEGVGGSLSAEMQTILSAATDDAMSALVAKHAILSAELKKIFKAMRKLPLGEARKTFALENMDQAEFLNEKMHSYLSQIQSMKN